ncbi:hypothetical protein ColTof4_13570 [Colletotrichum tofieldiae]|nr:hypothetical protein ColTof3_14521 [Colletotrichum tofieldiae]GKT81147.1 hypothetical protein ColTof4_13570 [Colletotrichum tofieldiae]
MTGRRRRTAARHGTKQQDPCLSTGEDEGGLEVENEVSVVEDEEDEKEDEEEYDEGEKDEQGPLGPASSIPSGCDGRWRAGPRVNLEPHLSQSCRHTPKSTGAAAAFGASLLQIVPPAAALQRQSGPRPPQQLSECPPHRHGTVRFPPALVACMISINAQGLLG